MTVEKVKRYELNIAELMQAEGSENQKLINSVWNKHNCLNSESLFSEGSLPVSITHRSINSADCHILCII